jgi:hypothetical protein
MKKPVIELRLFDKYCVEAKTKPLPLVKEVVDAGICGMADTQIRQFVESDCQIRLFGVDELASIYNGVLTAHNSWN